MVTFKFLEYYLGKQGVITLAGDNSAFPRLARHTRLRRKFGSPASGTWHKMRLREAPHSLEMPEVVAELGSVLIRDTCACSRPALTWALPCGHPHLPLGSCSRSSRDASCSGNCILLSWDTSWSWEVPGKGLFCHQGCPGCSLRQLLFEGSQGTDPSCAFVPFPDGFGSCWVRESPSGLPCAGPQGPDSVTGS